MPTDSVPRRIKEPSTPACVPSTAQANPVASGTGVAFVSRPLLVSSGRFLAGLPPQSRSPSKPLRSLLREPLRLPLSAPPAAVRRITRRMLLSRPRATTATRAEMLRCRAFLAYKPHRLLPCLLLSPLAHRKATGPRLPPLFLDGGYRRTCSTNHDFSICFYQHTQTIPAFDRVCGKGSPGLYDYPRQGGFPWSDIHLLSLVTEDTEEQAGSRGHWYGTAFTVDSKGLCSHVREAF